MKNCPYCAEQVQDAAVVCKHCGKKIASASAVARVTPTPGPGRYARVAMLAVVAGVLLIGGGWVYQQTQASKRNREIADSVAVQAQRAQRAADSARAVKPRLIPLIDETKSLNAGQYQMVGALVGAGRQTCRMTGKLAAAAAGSDFNAYVFTDQQLINWQANTSSDAVWASGRVTEAGLDVELPGSGKYTLVVSNRTSILFAHQIQMQVRLVCVGQWP